MRSGSAQLQDMLYLSSTLRAAEVVTITCRDGTIYDWTSYDVPVTYSGLSWSMYPIKIGGYRTSTGLETDQVVVTVAPGLDSINGVAFAVAAARGKFDGAGVDVRHVFFSGTTAVATASAFSGSVSQPRPGSTQVELYVESVVARFPRQRLPFRSCETQCPYQLYSVACGVDKNSFSCGATASSYTAADNEIVLNATATFGSPGGFVLSTSGYNSGTLRSISAGGSGTNYVDLSAPFPYTVAANDTFVLYQGCDKTPPTCSGTFSNLPTFGGQPELPPTKDA